MKEISVLFVCLGNICRSPLAEGIFKYLVSEQGLSECFCIDSCGTGDWHVGHPPHAESRRVAKKHGISIDSLRARQLADDDFFKFQHIVAMDRSNLEDINAKKIGSFSNTFCLREFDSLKNDLDVPDPYYGGRDGFSLVYDIIYRSLVNLLVHFREKNNI